MPLCPSERSYKGQRLEISPYETGRPFRTSGGLRTFQGQGQGKNMAPTVSGGAPAHTKSNIRVFSFVFLYFPKGNLRWHFNDIMSNMGAHCQNTVSQWRCYVTFIRRRYKNTDAHNLFTTARYQSTYQRHKKASPLLSADISRALYVLYCNISDPCSYLVSVHWYWRSATDCSWTSGEFQSSYAFRVEATYVKMWDCHAQISNNTVMQAS